MCGLQNEPNTKPKQFKTLKQLRICLLHTLKSIDCVDASCTFAGLSWFSAIRNASRTSSACSEPKARNSKEEDGEDVVEQLRCCSQVHDLGLARVVRMWYDMLDCRFHVYRSCAGKKFGMNSE